MTIAEIDHSATRGSLQSEAYKRLREIIIRQELSPGSKVSELTLSRLTGYGRAPVRVALRGLVAEGLVQIVPQSGVVVARIEPKTELKVLEVRAELERLLTKCALNRATDRHRMRMLVIVHQLRNEVRKENLRFGTLLRDVHEVLTEAADNEFLTSVMDRIHALSRRFWYAHHETISDVERAAVLHAHRLLRVVEKDLKSATAASDAIVAHVESYVRRIMNLEANGRSAATQDGSDASRAIFAASPNENSLGKPGDTSWTRLQKRGARKQPQRVPVR